MKIEKGLKNIRKFKGLTQKELAEKLKVTSVTIQNYENNRRTPSINVLNSLAAALDVELNVILNGFEKDIFTNDDVLYTWGKLNTSISIQTYLEENNQSAYSFLITSCPDTLDGFYLISDKLKLSENEFSNWIKSVAIKKFIQTDTELTLLLSDEIIKALIKSNTLVPQSYSSLLDTGLSKENQKIVSDFILEKTFFKDTTKYLNNETQTTTYVYPKNNGDISYNEAIVGLTSYINYLANKENYIVAIEDYEDIIKSTEELITGKLLIFKKNSGTKLK